MEPTILTDYHAALRFQPQQFSPVALAETDHLKVVLTCFEPGQFIPVHAPDVDMALLVLEGSGTVVAGDTEADVSPGALMVVPAGHRRGVKATTRLVALHLVSPAPRATDHAAVQAGLQRGSWR